MMAATIESAGSTLVPHAAVALFNDEYVPNFPALANVDVSADGRHLLMIKGERSDPVAEIRVLQQWWKR
jgi:hypothetical protein